MLYSIEGVILDVDGTLIDSNDAHASAWVEALTEQGYKFPFKKIRCMIGMGGDKILATVLGFRKDTAQGKRISERRGQIFKDKYLSTLKPFPGVQQLLNRMKDEGLKLVIGTSAQPDELQDLLKIAKLSDFFEAQTSSGDVKNSKPDPDIIKVALDRLGLPTEKVVMIGDTPYDIVAAARAKVPTIALRCGGWADQDLKEALCVYNDPLDLLDRFDKSPLYTAHLNYHSGWMLNNSYSGLGNN